MGFFRGEFLALLSLDYLIRARSAMSALRKGIYRKNYICHALFRTPRNMGDSQCNHRSRITGIEKYPEANIGFRVLFVSVKLFYSYSLNSVLSLRYIDKIQVY